jgi:hypothetical protein
MLDFAYRLSRALFAPLCVIIGISGAALAADFPPRPPVVAEPVAPPPAWTFRFTPYGWLTAMDGTQTVRGQSVKVDASFLDIVENSDTLVALMGNFEARNGPFTLYSDLVWSKVGVDPSHVRTRTIAPGIVGTIGTALDVSVEMAIVEAGAAYEVLRVGPVAFDVLAGARYWYQDADLLFDIAATIEIGDLEIAGARAIARSGSVDWLDPVIGARLHYAVAPGHELFLRGDIGGFGAGSEFSWQAIGGYGFDFGAWRGVTFSGIIGYRALYVDYAQGEDRTRYEFDMLLHGPVLGISMRF